jgi:hypothetical protein
MSEGRGPKLEGFHFGLEAEFMLADAESYKPLWYQDTSFETLDGLFSSLDFSGFDVSNLAAEPPHKKLMPFIVEGYSVFNEAGEPYSALPKGVEIRTPVYKDLTTLLDSYKQLTDKLTRALKSIQRVPVAISHHPIHSTFMGPQHKRRHDYWQWAMEVMTTYGPDINISLPQEYSAYVFSHQKYFERRINYYAPMLAALSLSSPFKEGELWQVHGRLGLSYRTYKRSLKAPPLEWHADESERIEFKVFEMTPDVADFEAYFLLTLVLFLDEKLAGEASDQERIYDLGACARFGLQAEGLYARFEEFISRSFVTLREWGFSSAPLEAFIHRRETQGLLAEQMQRQFLSGMPLSEIMCMYGQFRDSRVPHEKHLAY